MNADASDRYQNVVRNLARGCAAVLGEPCRVASRQHLTTLSGCKDMIGNVSGSAGWFALWIC